MNSDLQRALERVAKRYRRVRFWGGLALCWLFWSAACAALSLMASQPGNAWVLGGRSLLACAAVAVLSALVCGLLAHRSVRDPRWVARRIEERHPELATGLLAAVEQDEASAGGARTFLQAAVIGQALRHRRRRDWEAIVSPWAIRGAELAHAVALGVLLLTLVGLVRESRSRAAERSAQAALGALADIAVDPGDVSLERGSTLLVVARFGGRVPAEAQLVVEDAKDAGARRGMSRSLEDPTFAGRVESVNTDLAYHVAFDDRRSPTYHVRVFEYPELQRTDAKLDYPAYTALPAKTVEDVRHVTAVEGTKTTLLFRLNKEVAAARLLDEKGQAIDLAPVQEGEPVYRAQLTLADSQRYKLQLLDREGRRNKLPAELAVNVTRNRVPVITMTQPGRDMRVSPVEELRLKAKMEDDFGLIRHGLSYAVAGQENRDVVLKAGTPGPRTVQAEHVLDFESFHAAPDQLVTYFFWAEDYGPDGKSRRTSGDMYFAEVRHFEEIFRQGEQPPSNSAEQEQQDGGNAQQAEKLAELQKQIINGTWKLVRVETGAKPSEKFAADAKLLKESQHAAIEQAGELAGQLRDRVSRANLDQATRFMTDAETHLAEAVDKTAIAPFTPALAAEQAAYQALLKLRAREFEVIRNNSRRNRNSRSGGGGAQQQQLDQLELSNDENRYEQQKSARSQQEKQTQREREQAENRQISNRLRELAKRQNDLNDRLKELQSALEAAKNAEAREELQRQLKRLREQQQQVLRDADELRERMEREENRDRMAEARQQMEQSREHVRQASEALEQGRVAQALTEGTRAGRQMNELKEDLRKQSSNQFSEDMTEMRGDARRLDQDQARLSEQLEAWNQRPQRSLRDGADREQVKKGLEQQEKQLEQLVDRMRKTVQEAEESEPLLAKELFDTVRKTDERKIPDALQVAEQLTEAGVPQDAAKSSRRAGEGIQHLREGVERAAERVLGDETTALKRAQGELEELSGQVDREMARATGREPAGREEQAARPSQRQGGDPEKGARPRGSQGQDPSEGGRTDEPTKEDPQGKAQTNGQRPRPQGLRGERANPEPPQGQQAEPQPGQPGPGGRQPGGREGEQPAHEHAGGQQQGDSPQGQGEQAGPPGSPRGGNANRQDGLNRALEGMNRGGPGGPITGAGFREWVDRMRDVEELIQDPEMRAEAARIRDRVRGEREEFKRHAKEPDWAKLKDMVADPLRELRDRIAEEVRRRETPDALVPIDRDPVPSQYAESVRKYYERLGGGR
ncbi:MAG: hypothetical protein P4L84_17850 [Isosphaeraceae bacterium]|nr:hypothetical protein [Isosphaeraceae bacterium]